MPHAVLSSAPSLTQRFLRDNRGGAAVLGAILFPVVIGGMGLGAETGYWYMTQRKLQHVADGSVHAAAVRKGAGATKIEIDTAASHVATSSGFQASIGTLVVNNPPLSGSKAGDGASVEVLLTETQPRLLSSVFSKEPVKIDARAVATLRWTSKACVLALSPGGAGAVTISGSTSVDLAGCDVASNSTASDSFLMSGSSAGLSTGCVFSVGGAVATSGLALTRCTEPVVQAPPVQDPYKSVAEPAVVGTCRSKNVGSPNSSTTLTPSENHPSGVKSMRFCGGLDVKGKVTFEPGLYIIDGGDFTVNAGDVSSSAVAELLGAGVTFYLANGARLKLGGNAFLNVSAPTAGPFSGILFFGSRSATGVIHQLTGASGSTLNGAIYSPASHIEFKGNSKTSGGCTQIIGNRVTFTGNSSLKQECDGAGTSDVLTGLTVNIVE